ncbi:MAG: PrpR N-terminal domain-containing protein [Ruthenibacterium sp.]
MENSGKVYFIGYKKLSDMARVILSRPEFSDVVLVDSGVDQLHHVIDEATANGCEVFVAGSANAAELRRYSGVPLIELQVRLIDYLLAVRKAFSMGRFPVVAVYRYAKTISLTDFPTLFDSPVACIEYTSSEELLEKLAASGADVAVGASQVNEAAEQLNMQSVFVHPGQETIAEAVLRAHSLRNTLHKERRNAEFVNTIVSESTTGIIGLSERREVLLVNSAAKRLTGSTAEQLRRTGLRQLIPDEEFNALMEGDKKNVCLLRPLDGKPLKVQLTKIEEHGRSLGALLLLERPISTDACTAPDQISAFSYLPGFYDVVHLSPAMQKTMTSAKKLGAVPDMPLFVVGEHGAGKELLTQSIYSAFYADKGDYVCLNCATVSDSEAARLFHGPVGKTVAAQDARMLDPAGVGVLVLENIWEASGKLQSALVWAASGCAEAFTVNCGGSPPPFKIITVVPDEQLSLFEKQVRPDLRYLLQTLTLPVPPLRERKEDVMQLFARCLKGSSVQNRTDYTLDAGLSPILTGYSWPGNMYELRAVCQRYALGLAADRLTLVGKKRLLISCIGEDALFADVLASADGCANPDALSGTALAELAERLKSVLLYSNDQIARKLGISRTSMWRKLQPTPPVSPGSDVTTCSNSGPDCE